MAAKESISAKRSPYLAEGSLNRGVLSDDGVFCSEGSGSQRSPRELQKVLTLLVLLLLTMV